MSILKAKLMILTMDVLMIDFIHVKLPKTQFVYKTYNFVISILLTRHINKRRYFLPSHNLS